MNYQSINKETKYNIFRDNVNETIFNDQKKKILESMVINKRVIGPPQLIIYIGNCILKKPDNNKLCKAAACNNISHAYRMLYIETYDEKYMEYAIMYCETAKKYDPSSTNMNIGMLMNSLLVGDFKRALKIFKGMGTCVTETIYTEISFYLETIFSLKLKEYSKEEIGDLKKFIEYYCFVYKNYLQSYLVTGLFYMVMADDPIRAYELFRKELEKDNNNAYVYCNLGYLCTYDAIKKYDDAIDYCLKGLEITKKTNEIEVSNNIECNLLAAYLAKKDYTNALKLGEKVVKSNPNNTNYFNYARALECNKEYDKAIEWCEKSLFIVEDDCGLFLLADIYFNKQEYTKAVELYFKCLASMDENGEKYEFNDCKDIKMCSVATKNSMVMTKYKVYSSLVKCFNRMNDYKNARIYLELGKKEYPDGDEWQIWDETLSKIENIDNDLALVKKSLENEREKGNYNCFRVWSEKLIRLQNSPNGNFDRLKYWSRFSRKMDSIINEMLEEVDENNFLEFDDKYSYLDDDSKKFLCTADLLYEKNKNNFIDFAPIIVEYSKVVEKRLRILIANNLSDNDIMLGQIIRRIQKENIKPYINFIKQLIDINELRKKSAHIGLLKTEDVELIRKILFEEKLLEKLA